MARKNWLHAAIFGLVFPVSLLFLFFFTHIHLADSDRYFHLALSRLLAESKVFWLQSLPQVHGLGWGDYFPDKDFLFHFFTSIGHRIAGENGAIAIGFLAALGTVWLMYGFALLYLPPWLAFLAVQSTIFHHAIIFRMLFFRPFVFAAFGFVTLNVGLLRKNRWTVAAGALFFSLSYHAFYFPLICLGTYLLVGFFEEKNLRSKFAPIALWGVAGLIVGTAINPYFPSNVVTGVLQAYGNYLAHHELSNVRFGAEIYALSAPAFLSFFGFPTLLLLASVGYLFGSSKKEYRFEVAYLSILAFFFWLVSVQSVRGAEYFFPFVFFLFVFLLREFLQRKVAVRAAYVFAALQFCSFAVALTSEIGVYYDKKLEDDIFAAVSAVPVQGARVFNCDWAQGSYLLYSRPDLSFVDILDPISLYFRDRSKFETREKLRLGMIPDATDEIQKTFGAEFVLCSAGKLVRQLQGDLFAKQLFPKAYESSSVFLFQLLPRKNFVTEWNWAPLAFFNSGDAKKFVPKDLPRSHILHGKPPGNFFRFPGRLREQDLTCLALEIPAEELKKHKGAEYLSLGGGPTARVWRNGKLLYASGSAFQSPSMFQALIPLKPPLNATDKIESLYCTGGENEPLGAAVSFWSEGELRSLCQGRRNSEPTGGDWLTTEQRTCAGAMAQPVPPAAIRP